MRQQIANVSSSVLSKSIWYNDYKISYKYYMQGI